MMSRSSILLGLGAAALVLVLGFCWKRDQDVKASGRIAQLDSALVVERREREKAQRETDSVTQVLELAKTRQAKADTVWRTRSVTTINAIHDIARDTTISDSAKVDRIVARADSLKAWGDSLAEAGSQLRGEIGTLQDKHARERAAWAREVATLTEQNTLLKKQSRHWGLGGGFGYGVTRVKLPGSGQYVVVPGPQATAGVVYRW